jgi:hypothetical protein
MERDLATELDKAGRLWSALSGRSLRRRRVGARGASALVAVLALVAAGAGACGPAASGNQNASPSSTVATGTPMASRSAEPLPFGLPATVEGQTVQSVDAFLASPPSDNREILVGGWLGLDLAACVKQDSPEGRLIPSCGYYYLREGPSSGPTVRLAGPVGVTVMPDAGYAVVLHVHAHDALAASCKPESRPVCEQAAVVDSAVWTEPLQTYAPKPGSETFRYPASWRLISGYQSLDRDGPRLNWVVGTGDFELGCNRTASGGVSCRRPTAWTVPDDGVVVAWYSGAYSPAFSQRLPLGPSPAPGYTRTSLGGEACRGIGPGTCLPADMVESATGFLLYFDGNKISVLEARWGPKNAELSRAQALAVIASWRLTLPAGATPSP